MIFKKKCRVNIKVKLIKYKEMTVLGYMIFSSGRYVEADTKQIMNSFYRYQRHCKNSKYMMELMR